MRTDGLSIGALSKQSGVNIETIRYYEKIGVMPAPARSAGGYRMYTVDHLKRLGFVRRGRQLEIADLRRLERVLADMAAQCTEDQVPECPVVDALFGSVAH